MSLVAKIHYKSHDKPRHSKVLKSLHIMTINDNNYWIDQTPLIMTEVVQAHPGTTRSNVRWRQVLCP